MNSFTLGSTEFGINTQESQITIASDLTQPNQALLTIDVAGDNEIFQTLSTPQDSKWSWALYPPSLYLNDIPIPLKIATEGGEVYFVNRNDFEIGLYMMEHCEITDITVTLISQREVNVKGTVDLWGKEMPFAVNYTYTSYAT
jgi:hypothetical protein